MKHLNFCLILLIIAIISFCGCNNNSSKLEEQKRVFIKYKNGLTFCEGIHSVLKKSGLPKKRIGIWRFYYPDGKLFDIFEYDDNGELINWKTYNGDGILIYSEADTDNFTNVIYYYDNGKIKTESISQVITKSRGEDEYEITHGTQKWYFPNGQLHEQQYLEDGILEGVASIWDTSGNLVLSIKYKNGFIVP